MRIRKILLILAAGILYAFAVFFCWSAKEDANCTYLLFSEPIDAARAEDIFTQEAALTDSIGFCFWGEKENQWVSCRETGSIAEVTQVLLSGNPGLLDAGVLAWQEGCFLDEATAQKLFGTVDCSEQTAWQDDRPYRVFGTVSATQPTMLTVAEKTDGLILNRCVLNVTAETGKQTAQQFLLRWGLTGELIDFYPLWVAAHNVLLMLPGILLLICGIRELKRKSRLRSLAAGVLCLLLCSQIRILPDMIPSRWSDFAFWGNWLEAQRSNIQMVLMTPMGERHLQMMLGMVKSLVCAATGFWLTLWAVK